MRSVYTLQKCRSLYLGISAYIEKRVKLEAHTKHDREKERHVLIVSKWRYKSRNFPQNSLDMGRYSWRGLRQKIYVLHDNEI